MSDEKQEPCPRCRALAAALEAAIRHFVSRPRVYTPGVDGYFTVMVSEPFMEATAALVNEAALAEAQGGGEE